MDDGSASSPVLESEQEIGIAGSSAAVGRVRAVEKESPSPLAAADEGAGGGVRMLFIIPYNVLFLIFPLGGYADMGQGGRAFIFHPTACRE